MNAFHTLLDRAGFAAQSLNPLERFEAARDWGPAAGSWIGTSLLVALLIAVAAAVSMMLFRRFRLEKHRKEVLHRQSEQAGLTEPERYVMQAIVKAAKLRNLEMLFTTAAAFQRGVAMLEHTPRVTGMSPEKRRGVDELIGSLRSKLDLGPSDGPQGPAGEELGEGLDGLAAGDRLSVTYRGRPTTFDVSVQEAGEDELVVGAPGLLDCEPGETWLVRYSKGGKLWEFDAPVLESRQGSIRLSRSGQARFINRRRFPRVPTSRPAQVASFPFLTSNMGLGSQDLVPGELVEIAGTGLRLETPVDARVGDRVLLALRFGEEVIEAVGRVRRAVQNPDQGSALVVELLGLTEQEIAKLTHETNVAAHENAQPKDAEPDTPRWRDLLDSVGQEAAQRD